MKSSPGVTTHIRAGVFYCILAASIQGLAESIILSVSYTGYILMPVDAFKINLFIILRKVLGLGTGESIPFILDRYLGPDFTDKVPLILNVVTVYAIFGLLGGVFLGIFMWAAFKFLKKSLDYRELSFFYLSFVLGFLVFINLIIWLNKFEIMEIVSFWGFVLILGLIACAVFMSVVIYRLVLKSSESDKTVPSNITGKSKLAVLSVLLIACTALILNLSVFRGKEHSEILLAKTNNTTHKGLAKPKDKNINVILISIDTLRADHLSCYGYGRTTSPNIDRLANEGIAFSNAFSVASWTLPAHISMLTSMYSEAHGVITDENSLDENRVTLAEILKDRGYATAAFVSGVYLHSRYGFDQGFDVYDESIIDNAERGGEDLVQEVTSPSLNDSIQSWLKINNQKKFFLFLHYFDVHFDYIPPPPYDTMFGLDYKGKIDGRNFYNNPEINSEMDPRDLKHVIALYDGEIAFTDKYIGE
ncbi:MAG: sulfatase-like hydrolase/transferase, partial [Deltaproteobacteria bacterium]|nr:sulfatase-like hydrolase/transferase [Deltaproteobacteria bacterium]